MRRAESARRIYPHADGSITGTLTVTPSERLTVGFAVQMGVPGTAGWTTDVTNRACVYPADGKTDECIWSDTVTNRAFRPYGVYLPLVVKGHQ